MNTSVAVATPRMITHERPCPACGNPTQPYFTTIDFNRSTSTEFFTYCRCDRCGLIFLRDPPPDFSPYYADDYYALPTPAKLRLIARKVGPQIDIVRQFESSGHLVDIGAAFGAFAFHAKQVGFDVTAIEMDRRCSDYLRAAVGVEVVRTNRPEVALKSLPQSRVVTLWHVLEHLQSPWDCLESVASNLALGGICVVATPNPDALQFRFLRSRWPHIDAPRHTCLIPIDLLTRKASHHGLSRIFLTTDDRAGRRWNRFGWQRFLMNHAKGRGLRGVGFGAGLLIAAAFSPFERRELRGSTYTAVFRKEGV